MRPLLTPLVPAGLALLLGTAPALLGGERTQESLRQVLPKYDPAQHAAAREADAAKVARPVAEDGLTILPDFNVVEKKVYQPEADQWFTDAAINAREARRAEAEMNPLEMLLNRWSIPLLSASFAQRTRSAYETKKLREKIGGYLDLARQLEKTDPKAAKKIRDALDFRKLPKDDD